MQIRAWLFTAVAVVCILGAIALNTTFALNRTLEQSNTLGQQRSVASVKHNLDALQDALLSEHEQLYTVIGVRLFYRHPTYVYPLPALMNYAGAAQRSCGGEQHCVALVLELKLMVRNLGSLSNELARRAMLKQGAVTMSAPLLGELDARFFQTMQKIGEVRVAEDETLDVSVSKASHDAQVVSELLLGSGLAAGLLLLALLYRNARITATLRRALKTADTNREKYQRLFQQNPLPIWIVDDESGHVVAVNEMAKKATEYSADEMLALALCDIRVVSAQGHRAPAAEAHTLKDGADEIWTLRTKGGNLRSMVSFHLQTEFDGRSATMYVMEDITRQLVAQDELFRSMQMLQHVLDNIPTGIAWKDSSLRYVGGNEIYARDAGLASRRDLIGLTDEQLSWRDDPAVVRAEDRQIMQGDLVKRGVERASVSVDGSPVWIAETKLPLIDPSGNGVGVLTAYENITAIRQSQLALRIQGRALDASISGIVIAEAKSGIHSVTYANRAFEKMTGRSFAQIEGADFGCLLEQGDNAAGWAEIRAALDAGVDANVTLPCRHKNGGVFWCNVLIAPVTAADGDITHHIAIMSDVTKVIEYQAELKRQAQFDSLTGRPNRHQLEERLSVALRRAALSSEPVIAIFLDLDRFKEVNDSLGHRVGDALLAQVARRLMDAAGERCTVARYGEDEFMVIADGMQAETLTALLDKILAAMTEPVRVSGHELFVEASMGISVFPTDGADADTLIRNADAAMYLAKQNGRNQYQFYRAEMSDAVASRLRVSTRLRRAFKDDTLRVLYQPQFDMLTGAIIGAEALTRWTDAELGEISPSVFIPIAEDTGLIRSIGEWVLREACREGARWNENSHCPIRISVNVSPLQLENGNLVEQVRNALSDSGLAPELLELEVTEGALMRNVENAAKTLACLRKLGVRIAIDDFGTGYSSLSFLKRFRVDRLKIDREFVTEIGQDSEMEAITLAVIAVAKALNFELIAEGVETNLHRDFLLRHGCTEAQGFLYSAAVSGDTILELTFPPSFRAGRTSSC